jgi:hypothetical protein
MPRDSVSRLKAHARARFDARVQEENERVTPHARLAESLAQAAACARGRPGLVRGGQRPEAERRVEAGGEQPEAGCQKQVAGAPAPRVDREHGGHAERPEHRAEAPAGVEPGDRAGREARRREGVDARVDRARAEAGEAREADDQAPERRHGPRGRARGDEQAAQDQQPADAEALDQRARGEARDEVARRPGQQDPAEAVDRLVEAVPERRPGDPQHAVGQAEAHEGQEGQGNDPGSRGVRHAGLSPVEWWFDH